MSILNEAFSLPFVRSILLKSKLSFVDVGAAVGVEEPWLTMVSDCECTDVYAFEPNEENLQNIRRLKNGKYFNYAIGDKDEKLPFFLDGTGSSLVDREYFGGMKPSITVDVFRLETLRENNTIRCLDVLKTDAECFDFEVISGAGRFLSDELLAVQCEFSFHPEGERAFRDYDALLQNAGFRLHGLSMQRGAFGDLAGGNFLYLRSLPSLLAAERIVVEQRLIKMFIVSLALSKIDLAYMIVRCLEHFELFSDLDRKSLKNILEKYVYLPDCLPMSNFLVKIGTVIGNIQSIIVGQNWRSVSAPSSNRLEYYRKALVRKNFIFNDSSAKALYELYFQNEISKMIVSGGSLRTIEPTTP